MKRYIALLRDINISGKNKIPMAELKKEFGKLGFKKVNFQLPVCINVKDCMFKDNNMKNIIIWIWGIPNLPRNKGDDFVLSI